MAQSSIGDFYFLSLDGAVQPPSQRIEPFQRPGVEGTGFTAGGWAGVPFMLRSRVDGVNLVVCAQAFAEYLLYKEAGPKRLVKGGIDYYHDFRPWVVKVVDVKLALMESRLTAVGGLNWPSLAWLEADWTLIGVEL